MNESLYGTAMKTEGSLLMSISTGKRFGWKICLCHVTCKCRMADDPIFGIPDSDMPIRYTTLIRLR